MSSVKITALFTMALLTATSAALACTNPTGTEGQIVYNGTFKIPQYCNGTQWVAWGSGFGVSTDRITSGTTGVVTSNAGGGSITFTTGGAERMVVAGNGTLYVQTPSNAATLASVAITTPNNSYISMYPDMAAGAYSPLVQGGDGGLIFSDGSSDTGGFVIAQWSNSSRGLRISANGDFTVGAAAYKPGGGSWTATSDARLKDVNGDYTRGLAEISQLKPVHYRYKEDNPRKEPSDKAYVGLVAQEVLPVFPEAVSKADDGYYTLDSTPITFAMINAIKELKAENDTLRAEFEAYKAARP